MTAANTREVQLIATRADAGQFVTSGFFRMSLDYRGLTDIDPEQHTQTQLIPFNASVDQMTAALEGISTIDVIEVRRYGPTSQNTYEWKVTLDWTARRGPLPLMIVSQQLQFDVTWNGGSHNVVWVRELTRGTLGPTFCDVNCKHTVTGLSPGWQYQFRVRAHSAAGWGQWSGSSSIVTTPELAPPGTPNAPELVSAGPDWITLSLVRRVYTGSACVRVCVRVRVRVRAG